jgi:hypothetical protein
MAAIRRLLIFSMAAASWLPCVLFICGRKEQVAVFFFLRGETVLWW